MNNLYHILKSIFQKRFLVIAYIVLIALTVMFVAQQQLRIDSIGANNPNEPFVNRSLYLASVEIMYPDNRTQTIFAGLKLCKRMKAMKSPEKVSFFTWVRYWEVFENGRINRIPFRATDGVYWDVMKFRFVEGLPYSEKDVAENKPLVVISETSRKRFFGNETQVVGRQIEIEGLRLTVCGVVENVPYSSTYAFGEFWMPYTAWGGKIHGDILFEKDFNDNLNLIRNIINEEKERNFLEFELTYELIKGKSEDLAEKLKYTISLSKQISSVLAKGLNGNPRHCKRFLNSMELRIMMANFRKIPLDRKILAKLMLVEYFKDPFYKRLAQLQARENGKPTELVNIEKGNWDEADILMTWKEDAWIAEWLNDIEPSLANVDLRPYFYFSRESQKNISYIRSQNLSRDAIKILQHLISGTDTLRNEALKLSISISDFEASSILNELASKIESATEIEKSLFQSFIEWGGSRKELYIDTVAILERLPSDKIKVSFIPLIPPFAKKLTDKAKIIELMTKWESQKSLKSAIVDEIKNIK